MKLRPPRRARLPDEPANGIHTSLPDRERVHRLRIYIVATTDEGTRAALGAAQMFAAGMPATIHLLVPHVIPYPQSLECPTALDFTVDRFRSAAAACTADI